MLSVLVGGQPQENRGISTAGGGGGSFVVTTSNNALQYLVVAGGGGGGGNAITDSPAKHGQAGSAGGAATNSGGAGGTNQTGGRGGSGQYAASGGGGVLTNGSGNAGGQSFVNGGRGGRQDQTGDNAGFGGGGASFILIGTNGASIAGGGGGGYSGGGGASANGNGTGGGYGGGGGSYNGGTDQFAAVGAANGNSGNGLVIISYPSPPQPIRYVNATASGLGDGSSWANASSNLQAMIDASGVEQVWVAGGHYTRSSGGNSFVMKNGVAIYGGFRGTETALSQRPAVNPVAGQLSSTTLTVGSGGGRVINNDNNGLNSTAQLDGVVITGGNADQGGGIYNDSSSPALTNCAITNNSATDGGGIRNRNSSTTLTNCTITNNFATTSKFGSGGGVLNVAASNPTFINCIISNNSASRSGGGVYSSYSRPTFINCIISNNSTDLGGGIYNFSSNANLTNCLLAANSANLGGALRNEQDSRPSLINCTLTANRAGAGAALINYSSSQPQLTNCILWDNQEAANTSINNDTGTGVTASYCLIGSGEPDVTGSNNLTATSSPFVGGTDYRLNACSVAINAGDPNSNPTTSGTTDLVGTPRFFQNGRIDIGTYEYQGSPAQPVAITSQPPSASSVTAGASVTAPVSVTGSVSGYQWYKDNLSNAVSGQTSAALTLTNVQNSDAGSYSLVVTGTCNSVTSTAFNLSVSPAVTGAPTLDSPASSTTTNGLPTFAGSAPASSSVRVIISGTASLTLTTTATGGGTFNVSSGSPLASGSYAAYAVAMTSGQTTSAPSASNNFTVDNTAPSVILSSAVANNAISPSSPVSFTATFSESVSGFTTSGISVSNGSVSNLSGSGASYSFLVTPATAGQATSVQVLANAAQDGVDNANTASTMYGFTYQQPMTGAPTLSSPANGTIINTPTPTYTGNAPTGSQVSVFVDNQLIGQTQAATGSFALTQPSTLSEGPHQIYATAQISGQTASMASATNSFTVDTTRPSVSVTSTQVTNGATTTIATVTFSAQFSEPVSGFSTSGITVSNGTASNLTGSGTSYSFQVTATGPGPVGVAVNANAAQDAATNANTASDSYGFTLTPGDFAIRSVDTRQCQLVDASRGEYRVSFTPVYSGLNGTPVSLRVINEVDATTAPGPYTIRLYSDNPTVALLAQQAASPDARFSYAWLAACQGSVAPNRPPTTTGIPAQQLVQNQPYQLELTRYFADPDGQALTYSSSALPAGLTLAGTTISGSPTAPGRTSVRITAIDPGGLSVATDVAMQVDAPPITTPPAGFTITGVTDLTCVAVTATERQVTFSPVYSGLDGSSVRFRVVNEQNFGTAPGPYSVRLYTDNPAITLEAVQAGQTATYRYDWLNACGSQSPPTVTNRPPVVVVPIAPQSATVGQGYSFYVPANTFADPEGEPLSLRTGALPAGLSFSASLSAIIGTPAQAGTSTIQLTASDPAGQRVSLSFTLQVVAGAATPPTPPAGFTITGVGSVTCLSVSSTERRLSFFPQYTGVDGSPIRFAVVNEQDFGTAPGPYSLRLYTDNPAITLTATQGGSAASYRYNWLAACASPANGRQAVAEAGSRLSVVVLGNPVIDGQLRLELQGVAGQPADLRLVSPAGQLLSQTFIESVVEGEPQTLDIRANWGTILLLQVRSGGQQQTIKVIQTR
ncbi:putative Ig domain-containing protein [uncultured Spirosoma sp.]|uniref:beta strand repeat-containing protein n=1 Tax=uncultured Spirosoma sp. TaxID=278208 RepID=UPI002582A2C1|nr:putative Ig domain-containing protein [uncultured Spirosoma sp.]